MAAPKEQQKAASMALRSAGTKGCPMAVLRVWRKAVPTESATAANSVGSLAAQTDG